MYIFVVAGIIDEVIIGAGFIIAQGIYENRTKVRKLFGQEKMPLRSEALNELE